MSRLPYLTPFKTFLFSKPPLRSAHEGFSVFDRPDQRLDRQGLRLVHPDRCRRLDLRGYCDQTIPRADPVVLRSQLHDVRLSVHDGGSLCLIPRFPCARRCCLSAVETKNPSDHRTHSLCFILLSRHFGANLCGHRLRLAILDL